MWYEDEDFDDDYLEDGDDFGWDDDDEDDDFYDDDNDYNPADWW